MRVDFVFINEKGLISLLALVVSLLETLPDFHVLFRYVQSPFS